MSATDARPTISQVFEDGTIIELLFDRDTSSTALAVAENGDIKVVEGYDAPTGERLIPYGASNNLIASGCVLLPSRPADVGEVGDVRDIVADIRSYLSRYVFLSPDFETLVPYYVLLSWVYDAFNEVPYLRTLGDAGRGKTRRLLAIGSICYKPFFASGASTVSPIFHVLDAFGGTLVLDEADFRFSDATSELTKILNNGTVRGLPILRTMTNRHRELNPQAFRVFGPKIVAMREPFTDDGLESRFFTERPNDRALPAHIPLHTPPEMHAEALQLRNRLLTWRLLHRGKVRTKPERTIARISPRRNQMALSLLSLVEDDAELAQVADILSRDSDDHLSTASEDEMKRLVGAALRAFERTTGATVPLSTIVEVFNSSIPNAKPLSSKSIGWMVRSRLNVETYKSRGVSVISQAQRQRIDALARRFGLDCSDDSKACVSDAAASAADKAVSTAAGEALRE
jgi:hypothetical protein